MRNLLIKFRENQNHVINDIYKALGAEDYKTAERLAHSVKGLASIIEAPELYKIAAELEAGIHIESLEKIEVFMAKLDQSLKRVFISIDLLKESHIIAEVLDLRPINIPVLKQSLDKLSKLLLDNDAEALECIEEIVRQTQKTLIASNVIKMKAYSDRYRFEDAVKVLEEIYSILDGERKNG